jgi:hypothetical protein
VQGSAVVGRTVFPILATLVSADRCPPARRSKWGMTHAAMSVVSKGSLRGRAGARTDDRA